MEQIRFVNQETVQRGRKKPLRVILLICAILVTVGNLVLILTGGLGEVTFFTGILLPCLLWIQVLRQSVLRNVQISVEEILGCGEDGINIRIAEIDRGDLFGSHSEWILCPRERVTGLVTYEESRILEIVGRPIFYFQKENEELMLDTADEFDEDYALRFFCSEDNYLQILHLVQRGLQRIAVKGEE